MQRIIDFISNPVRRMGSLLVVALLVSAAAAALYAPAPPPDDWVFDKTVNNVDFYHKLADCGGKKVVLLKLNNKNNYRVKVAWKEVFDTQMQKGVEGFKGTKNMVVAPGEAHAASCTNNLQKELVILPDDVNPTYSVSISSFNYKDISVSTAQ